jgi:peptidoglycan-associated lipoprotein
MLRFALVLAIVTLLAVGCAKKPTEDMTTKAPVASEQTADTGMNDSGMTETAITETPAMEKTMATVSDLTRVYFDFDSYVLSDVTRATLKQNAMILKSTPMLKVKIEGHCDERGSDDYNLALGEQRAQSTMDYLASLGVSKSQMSVVSMGELMPLDRASNEEAWAKNRRAEFRAQ